MPRHVCSLFIISVSCHSLCSNVTIMQNWQHHRRQLFLNCKSHLLEIKNYQFKNYINITKEVCHGFLFSDLYWGSLYLVPHSLTLIQWNNVWYRDFTLILVKRIPFWWRDYIADIVNVWSQDDGANIQPRTIRYGLCQN